jgi:cytochrome c oxidase assembly protein subunit 11
MAGEKKSNRKIFIIAGIAAGVMFGFSFAMVPIYSLICKATGINTSAPGSGLLTAVDYETKEPPDLTRTITVQFIAVNHNSMPWEFYPKTKTIDVHPGENNKIFFYVKNATDKDMTVQAIPSMTPPEALSHFHKIECFCFTQQSLKAREGKDMPMIFRIDKDIPKEVRVISLAYTLYDTTPKEETRKG